MSAIKEALEAAARALFLRTYQTPEEFEKLKSFYVEDMEAAVLAFLKTLRDSTQTAFDRYQRASLEVRAHELSDIISEIEGER
jgi:hypothetical protein